MPEPDAASTASPKTGDYPHTYVFDSAVDHASERSSRQASEGPPVLGVEREAIASRRRTTGVAHPPDYVVGLALSGGGIRSASFCLGVLQALDSQGCIPRIDYLSTVSGGGYIGCSMTGCMNAKPGCFPFNAAGDYSDTHAVQHIRDFSNYLMPRGARDIVVALGLIARGLAANSLLLSPFLLASIAILFICFPTRCSLETYGPLQWLVNRMAGRVPFMPGFPLTSVLAAVGFVFLLAWAFRKSTQTSDIAIVEDPGRSAAKSAELKGNWVNAWKLIVVFLSVGAWLELQPILFKAFLGIAPSPSDAASDGQSWFSLTKLAGATIQTWFTRIAPLLAPIAGVVTFLSRYLGHVSQLRGDDGRAALVKRLAAKALLWLAAIVVPSMLGLVYFAGTEGAQWLDGTVIHDKWDTFGWLFGAAIVCTGLALLIDPNTTSLHRLYRDRLSKAFLFDPSDHVAPNERKERADLEQIAPKLSEICPDACPYPVINAALNLQGSAFANKRGRNADFFEFTPNFVGCEATGWVGSARMQAIEPKLDLGTAMAVSGAAVSPNMGSATIKPLVPTLAVLNVRLGFWLTNPRHAKQVPTKTQRRTDFRSLLFLKELFQRIDETSKTVYVTDGGNIENLGIHALLRRRCKMIVAVDAEADPDLSFCSLLKLARYARIDFGALIDLPWQAIKAQGLAVRDALAKSEPLPVRPACQVAIGNIRYGPSVRGTLIYIKACVTGAEPDYVLDYKARNPQFPHETTGDQFFTEEQFEVYRALGFHAARRFLEDRAPFEVMPRDDETIEQARSRCRAEIRRALLGVEPAAEDANAPRT